jgi:hypothetical protein
MPAATLAPHAHKVDVDDHSRGSYLPSP